MIRQWTAILLFMGIGVTCILVAGWILLQAVLQVVHG